MMTPHGPDNKTFVKTSQEELKPVKMEGTMVCSVVFHTCYYYGVWNCMVSVVTSGLTM